MGPVFLLETFGPRLAQVENSNAPVYVWALRVFLVLVPTVLILAWLLRLRRQHLERRLQREAPEEIFKEARQAFRSQNTANIVLLLREPRRLTVEGLYAHAMVAYGESVAVTGLPADPAARGTQEFMVRGDEWALGVKVAGQPYFENAGSVASQLDQRHEKRAVRLHKAWIGVELAKRPGAADPETVYEVLLRLAGLLADENCLALLMPEKGQMTAYEPWLKPILLGPDPGLVWSLDVGPPVVVDPAELKPATAEAQRRWPQFLRVFDGRRTDRHFLVWAWLGTGDAQQRLWVKVGAIENQLIHGTVLSASGRPGHAPGSHVSFSTDAVYDWLICGDGPRVGGFTLNAYRQAARRGRATA